MIRLPWPCLLAAALLLASACATAPHRAPGAAPGDPDGDIPDGRPVITYSPATTPAQRLAGGGTNVRVNQDTSGRNQNETTMAVNATNALNLLGGANDARLGRWTSAWYASQDGGATWTDGTSPFQKYSTQGDPTATACGDGTMLFGYLDYNGAYQPSRFVVARSTDGAVTWAGFGTVSETATGYPFADKPYIACAPAGGTYGSRAYASWTSFGTTTSPIRLSYSTNRGATWTGEKSVSGSGGVQGSIPVAGRNGVVYDFWAGPSGVEFNKSINGAGTWATVKTVSSMTAIGDVNFRRPTFPTAAIDNSGGARDGYVYVAWHDGRNGDADILLSRTTNGGTTWSTPIRVNDDALGNGRDQFFPWIAVDSVGNVHLLWHDRRNDPADDKYEIFVATSRDGGLTFDTNIPISDVPSTGSLTNFLGDYAALAVGGGKMAPLWSDLRAGTGEEDAYTERQPIFFYDYVKGVTFRTDRQTIDFIDQEPRLGTGINYDVVTGDVADLAGGAPWTLATCATENLAAPPATVSANPTAGHAMYVLIRAQGPTGNGSYGPVLRHPDPRAGFDSATTLCN